MTCDTVTKIDPDGTKHYKPKVPFNTLDEAIAAAKKKNAADHTIEKLEAYKCTYCYKYHIGRNGKMVSDKEKAKYRRDLNIGPKIVGKINLVTLEPIQTMKVVGWIDLDKIRY